MSGLVTETDAWDQVKPARSYRSQDELDIREAVDRWGRAKWPEARVVHELVMQRGKVRADMAFVSPAHLVSVEIKSQWDTVDRLLNQIAMFRLATPETWIVADNRHARDADLLHYLLPSIGVARAERDKLHSGPFHVIEVRQPGAFASYPEALLSLLWVAELASECAIFRLGNAGPRATHASLVKSLMRLTTDEQIAAVCRQLRGRDALWRADPPVRAGAP